MPASRTAAGIQKCTSVSTALVVSAPLNFAGMGPFLARTSYVSAEALVSRERIKKDCYADVAFRTVRLIYVSGNVASRCPVRSASPKEKS